MVAPKLGSIQFQIAGTSDDTNGLLLLLQHKGVLGGYVRYLLSQQYNKLAGERLNYYINVSIRIA